MRLLLIVVSLLCAIVKGAGSEERLLKQLEAPVCNLLNTESGQFVLNGDCLANLRDVTPPFRIVSANGEARGWKSSTENAMMSFWRGDKELNCLKPFEVGASMESCTRGVWMAVERRNDETLIFLDVEGSNLNDDELVGKLAVLSSLASTEFLLFVSEYFNNFALNYLSSLERFRESSSILRKLKFGKLHIVVTSPLELESDLSLKEYILTKLDDNNDGMDEDRRLVKELLIQEDFEALTIEYENKLRRAKTKSNKDPPTISKDSEYYKSIENIVDTLRKSDETRKFENIETVIRFVEAVVEVFNNPERTAEVSLDFFGDFGASTDIFAGNMIESSENVKVLLQELQAEKEARLTAEKEKNEANLRAERAEKDVLKAQRDQAKSETAALKAQLAQERAEWRYRHSGGGSCFPGNAVVTTQNGAKKMNDLEIGDKVLVFDASVNEGLSYSAVIGFSFIRENLENGMLKFEYSSEGNGTRGTITLTEKHFIFAKRSVDTQFSMIEANDLTLGDTFIVSEYYTLDTAEGRITKITKTIERGKFAPITLTGNIFVDGVLCSNYDDPTGLGLSHDVWHFLVYPLRFFYSNSIFEDFFAELYLYLGHFVTHVGNALQDSGFSKFMGDMYSY